MKTFFYSTALLFASVLVYAQNSGVRYVSFFPPAHVVHTEVTLNQNDNSFDYVAESNAGVDAGNYHAKAGGLILGAADKSKIDITKISIATTSSDSKIYAIRNFMVENTIEIFAPNGRIGTIVVGSPCTTGGCQTAFLSANNVTLPVISSYAASGLTVNLQSSGVSDVTGVFLNNTGKKLFLEGLSSGEQMKWVWLRLDGTEECRRYLVKYKGTAPVNRCRKPTNDPLPC